MDSGTHVRLANHAWSVAELLRGSYRQHDYGKVILPFTVLRRLECVLAAPAGRPAFANASTHTLASIAADPEPAERLLEYLAAFSPQAREVLDSYEFPQQVRRLAAAGLLPQVAARFADLDLRQEVVGNHQVGYVFEDLIRRFAEQSNETAGEHFTPREVVELMVDLLVAPDRDALAVPGVVRTVFDPACGTGGMLSAAAERITRLNPDARVAVSGQELNGESWAICRSDLLITGRDPGAIALGNCFSHDGHPGATFDYLLANPPFGVEWKVVREVVEREHADLGHDGRFGAGLPPINDGSLLFLQHMLAKAKPVAEGGSRVALVFNGSPLFSGGADSGPSRIRRWVLENDWLEGVVALPDQLFYNTAISTYLWVLSNRKPARLRGKVILLDARDQWQRMRKSLGDKRKQISPEQVAEITRRYTTADGNSDAVKVLRTEDFGYRRITVERPLRLRFEVTEEALSALAAAKPVQRATDAAALADALRPLLGERWPDKATAWAAVRAAADSAGVPWPTTATAAKALRDILGTRDPDGEPQRAKGTPEPDPDLRDQENVPLTEDPEDFLRREVHPHAPDAWIDPAKTRIGYEIPFTRHFHVERPLRPLAEIDAEIRALDAEIRALLAKVID
ncbi:type I restriction-modification system subunit M [Actinokineospora bangkokensis]|uniref:site-specific DNA-methyltransferase (adenine-specific) n=1 Tax=Actinokineospora bangkokensis TaxID=1193682 RepID=A0A1Q9LQR5_9PSEU|nr:class I SAM-dependent DNA methyltransferase [Actinokineospora bangkokensis]OLR94360.1 restriction endonuclease subunit M [Actinokineospora bangkokensis]